MSLGDHIPVSESLGVFVGVAGFDWLAEGHAEPLKAAIVALAAGGILVAVRSLLNHRGRR